MDSEMFKRVLNYIDEHVCEKIELTELAELAGYSPFYFSKIFSENMGMPVTGYIRIRKLQYAMCSLLEGEKVLDVAVKYAFESHEGFTRSFTRLFGSTPSTVRKYLTTYSVPAIVVPELKYGEKAGRITMSIAKEMLEDNMHQMVFEVLKASMDEVQEGFCTRIEIALLEDGSIKIKDNGRGIPLSQDSQANKKILDSILAGHPVTGTEYVVMGDFKVSGLQAVNSLCENLQVNVYRDGMKFTQDYVRGIAQHEVVCTELEHDTGTEIILKPDSIIYGDGNFSEKIINTWIKEHGVSFEGVEVAILKEK